MRIDQHISYLLFHHNCVIVPGLGGFVANYQPAKMHPTSYIFNSPSKSIAFNVNLKNNDGLLINHISTAEKIPDRDAQLAVSEFVRDILFSLSEKKPVKVAEVGRLMCDVENNIQFIPDISKNYLLSSYGLNSVTAQPILRDRQVIKQLHSKKAGSLKKIRSKRKYKSVLPAAAILLFFILIAQYLVQIKVNGINTAELLGIESMFKQEDIALQVYNKPVKNIDAEYIKQYKNTSQVSKVITPAQPVNKNTVVQVNNPAEPDYYLIAGVFGRTAYAEKVIAQLSSTNYNAHVIQKNKRYMVAVDLPQGENKIRFRKQFIDASGISDAWILRNKSK